MADGNGTEERLALKAKEKILVQLRFHMCEPDDGVFPFEVTQKGLSEHLGIRRSHVASALQDLVREGLVTVAKGHVEGADRRQNVYCITSKGLSSADPIRDRVLSVEVSFETADGSSTVKVQEIVSSGKVTLASILNQIERGGPVRDEITVVTKPEKKLISVFCPTCKKQIEVDNVFFDEDVGFDCPGCGRPYRIVPATKKTPSYEQLPVAKGREANAPLLAVLVGLIVMAASVSIVQVCLIGPVMAGVVAGIVTWAVLRGKGKRRMTATRTPLGAVSATLALSPLALIFWHLTVASIHPGETLFVLGPAFGVVAAVYLAVRRYAPEFEGDCLFVSGAVLILVAVATMFATEFGPMDVGMAPVAGIGGAVLVVLSTFKPLDKDALVLDGAMAIGMLMLLATAAVLVWEASGPVDAIAVGTFAVVGVLLIASRLAREFLGTKEFSAHVVSAATFSFGVCLFVYGIFLMMGESYLPAAALIAASMPLAYLGAVKVFDEGRKYRLLLVAAFVATWALALFAGLVE